MTSNSGNLPSPPELEPVPEVVRDRRGMGMLLCGISSVASIAIVIAVAIQFLAPSNAEILADDGEQLPSITTASGD